jgi:hypothetical protein
MSLLTTSQPGFRPARNLVKRLLLSGHRTMVIPPSDNRSTPSGIAGHGPTSAAFSGVFIR